jgi:hypothetical protein
MVPGQFRTLGWDASIDRVGNVGRLGLAPSRPTAHLDTVLAPRNKDDIGVNSDGSFRGPGISDNGAGLTALRRRRGFAGVRSASRMSMGLAGSPTSAKRAKGTWRGCGISANSRRSLREGGRDGGRRRRQHGSHHGAGARHGASVTFTGPGGRGWSDHGIGNPVHALCRAVALFSKPGSTVE